MEVPAGLIPAAIRCPTTPSFAMGPRIGFDHLLPWRGRGTRGPQPRFARNLAGAGGEIGDHYFEERGRFVRPSQTVAAPAGLAGGRDRSLIFPHLRLRSQDRLWLRELNPYSSLDGG